MRKRLILSGLLVLALLAAITPFALAENSDTDTSTNIVPIYIDNQPVEFTTDAILVDSTTYVPLRDFCMAMGAEDVSWDAEAGTATVTSQNLTITATVGQVYIEANGRYLYTPDGILMLDGRMMAPLRALSKAFDAVLAWNPDSHSVFLFPGSGAIIPGSEYYDETDLYWLSRIINGEARGECLDGKIAVGDVIMNRIASEEFPNTVYDVVFDKRYGVQFTPAYNGSIYLTPTDESVLAAKLVLDGSNTAGESMYFNYNSACWAARNRPYSMTIGNHLFYL